MKSYGWWSRLRSGVKRFFRSEAFDGPGYLVSPLDLYDGMKGIEHSLYSMVGAWRNRCGPPRTPPETGRSDAQARDLARLLERYNPFAQAILTALRSYVLGEKGLTIEITAREGPGEQPLASDTTVESVQDWLDDYLDRDDWWQRERELYTRIHRDGEGIIRYFRDAAGIRLRFIEPECVTPPDSTGTFPEGVRTDPDDAETLESLWVQTGMTPADGEEVMADEVYMIKANVDKCIRRGLSDFASTSALLGKALDCLSCMIGSETERQSIILITHHEESTKQELDESVAAMTDYTLPAMSATGASTGVPARASFGISERHLTGKQRLSAMPDPGSIPAAINCINTALLSVGARYHMPLWVISGDASRNNALDLQAEGPFGRYIADEQAWFGRHVRNIIWRVLEIGAEAGELPAGVLDTIELCVTPQRPTEQRDPTKETARNQMLFQNELMGKPTWAAREGLDFEDEQHDIETYGGPPPGASPLAPMGSQEQTDGKSSFGGNGAEPQPRVPG